MAITTGAQAVAAAMTWLSTPYCWGGGHSGPVPVGTCVDCSGLVDQVYGIDGTTLDQIGMGAAVPDLSQAGPGDLVFFGPIAPGEPHHVGIYLGGGMMIDAPTTGTVVRVDALAGFGPVYGIRRLVGTTPGGTDASLLASGTSGGSASGAGADLTGGAGTGLSIWDILFSPGGFGEAGVRIGEAVAGGLLIAGGLLLVFLALAGKGEAALKATPAAKGARLARRGWRATEPRARPRAETRNAQREYLRRATAEGSERPFTAADETLTNGHRTRVRVRTMG